MVCPHASKLIISNVRLIAVMFLDKKNEISNIFKYLVVNKVEVLEVHRNYLSRNNL